ncbi:hypothetical protein GCM10022286_29210 [Gryllotalpicola daejeonensis]|uniref:Lysozyme n=1 Tax=Gryllotalpicola daejeonensis TaxID=993087 RepID=A0ABP7ZNA4_9MICO
MALITVVPLGGVVGSAAPAAAAAAPAAASAQQASVSSAQLADPAVSVQDARGDHVLGSSLASSAAGGIARSSVVSNAPGIDGLDVSWYQTLTAAQWVSLYKQGARFVYVKATESTNYVNSRFGEQYNDSYAAGLIHGAYHFATPSTSSGAAQAAYFLANGGAGTADGRTLPPMLDMESESGHPTCWGLSQAAMVSWINDFVTTIHNRIGRWPAIYSNKSWWTSCTGGVAFKADPFFIAYYPSGGKFSGGPGTLPGPWPTWTFWQYGSTGAFPGDQDVFNGSLAQLQALGLGTSLVRTVANATVYLLAGANKYPVASAAELSALSKLGQLGYVDQTFLNSFATQQTAGRIVRSPDGTIYFTDSGMKLPFSSCAMVEDYGGACAASGYVQLTDAQIAAFVTGPAVSQVLKLNSGQRFLLSGGKKRQILDNAAMSTAGVSGAGMNVLGPTALDNLPYGAPLVDDGVFAQVTGKSSYVLISGGKQFPVDASVVPVTTLPSGIAGTLDAGSVAQLPSGGAFTGVFQVTGTTQVRVLAQGGSVAWSGTVGGEKFVPVAVPQAFANRFAMKGTITASSAVMSKASATVYLVMPTQILPVGAWDSLVALSGGKTPVITTVPQAVLAGLPHGPVALTAGTLVRTPTDATVYLVNGVTNKIALSSFVYTTELGITKWSYTTQARLNAYPRASQLLRFGVTCGGQNYVSAGGQIHLVPSAEAALYPFSYVPLDQFTCALLKKGTQAGSFIRTPNGSIYQLSGGKKLPITTMARYTQLNKGAGYLQVAAEFAAEIPTGHNA